MSIWQGYQSLKQHFPELSKEKDAFFRLLSEALPQEDPEIQSHDGLSVDILWEKITVSITAGNTVSCSSTPSVDKIQYFQHSLDSIEFIKDSLRNPQQEFLDSFPSDASSDQILFAYLNRPFSNINNFEPLPNVQESRKKKHKMPLNFKCEKLDLSKEELDEAFANVKFFTPSLGCNTFTKCDNNT